MDHTLDERRNAYVATLEPLLDHCFLRRTLLHSTTVLANILLTHLREPQREPAAALGRFYDAHTPFLAGLRQDVQEAFDACPVTATANQDTDTIFGNAWTHYDPETYAHSISLVEERLKASGIDRKIIQGKRCFDGGCGIGRLSVALARLGAKEVVAVDRSDDCLDYFRAMLRRLGLSNVTVVKGDVTDLSAWPSSSFDFVATNGVLHHTDAPIKGLQEHMRVVRDTGTLWVYLYGKGGVYWPTFDALRPALREIGASEIRETLLGMHLRPGFVYTFLDNMLSPRTYHSIDEVIGVLSADYELTWREADGPSVFDSPSRAAASPSTRFLLGPQGEVRLVIEKIRSKHP